MSSDRLLSTVAMEIPSPTLLLASMLVRLTESASTRFSPAPPLSLTVALFTSASPSIDSRSIPCEVFPVIVALLIDTLEADEIARPRPRLSVATTSVKETAPTFRRSKPSSPLPVERIFSNVSDPATSLASTPSSPPDSTLRSRTVTSVAVLVIVMTSPVALVKMTSVARPVAPSSVTLFTMSSSSSYAPALTITVPPVATASIPSWTVLNAFTP